MNKNDSLRFRLAGLMLIAFGSAAANGEPPPPANPADTGLPFPRAPGESDQFPLPPSILAHDASDIDLKSALHLAGVQNPEILLAQQRVVYAMAQRQLAAAQFFPNINYGTSLDAHQGPLQQSSGNILRVNRDSMYFGLGSYAIAAGTVNIPGFQWWGNPSDTIFNTLISRQMVRMAEADSVAMRNDILLRVTDAYLDLLRAECRLVVGLQNRFETAEVAPSPPLMPAPARDERPTRIEPRTN